LASFHLSASRRSSWPPRIWGGNKWRIWSKFVCEWTGLKLKLKPNYSHNTMCYWRSSFHLNTPSCVFFRI
jgi:hypothetical protein